MPQIETSHGELGRNFWTQSQVAPEVVYQKVKATVLFQMRLMTLRCFLPDELTLSFS